MRRARPQPATASTAREARAARWPLATAAAAVALVAAIAPVRAADPQPKVEPRAPAPAPSRPGPGADDARDPKDHGGAGPNSRHKGESADAGEVVREFKDGAPIATVRAAFRCALEMSESAGFDCYAPLNVESNRNNDNARTHLQRYQWAHFRKWAPTYVVPGKEFALRLTRTVPAKIDADTKEIKFFFASVNRDNPAPITLRPEGGRWLIFANSL